MNQEEFYFGRTMDPCDYKATLANKLSKEDCVVVTAYNGRNKQNKRSKGEEK